MAIKLQAHECLVEIPGRPKPLRTLTSAVEAGKYGPNAKIIDRGKSTKASKSSDAETTKKGG